MLFEEPVPVRIDAPIAMAVARPPVSGEEFVADAAQARDEGTALHDDRTVEPTTFDEFGAGWSAIDDVAANQAPTTANPERRTEHWMPMSSGIERLWPPLEGVVAEFVEALELLDHAEVAMASVANVRALDTGRDAVFDDFPHAASTVDLPPAVLAQAAVRPPAPTEPHAPAPQAAVPPVAVQLPVEPVSSEQPPPSATVDAPKSEWVELIDSLRQDIERMRSTPPQPAPSRAPQPVAVAPGDLVSAHKPTRRVKAAHPIQDEWGFFDPEQCGFAALLAKLDEMTESCEETDTYAN
jgi:hypothetical protein